MKKGDSGGRVSERDKRGGSERRMRREEAEVAIKRRGWVKDEKRRRQGPVRE